MDSYAQFRCEACRAGAPPVSATELDAFLRERSGWTVAAEEGVRRLSRAFAFPDFASALAFAVRVGKLAEAESHHPAIGVEWGKATVEWWTHKIRDIHRNDLIMAAKTDALFDAPA